MSKTSKTKPSGLTCTVGGWGLARDGKKTVVEARPVRMLSQLSHDEKIAYYTSLAENPQMPKRTRDSARTWLADNAEPKRKRRKAS